MNNKIKLAIDNIKEKSVYVHVVHTNCAESFTDAFRIAQAFLNKGAKILSTFNAADIIVITTCGYMNCQRDLSIETITEFCEISTPSQVIIVCGCFLEIPLESKVFENLIVVDKISNATFHSKKLFIDVDSVVGPDISIANGFLNSLKHIDDLSKVVDLLEVKNGHTVESAKLKRNSPWYATDINKNVQFLRICHGCFGNCTYCAVKKIKGKPSSKPIEAIKHKVKESLLNGTNKFFLAADDAGVYGCDKNKLKYPYGLINLLQQLIYLSPDIELYINYLEPHALYSKELVSLLRTSTQIKRICIPMQSGSGRLVRKMRRNYNPDEIIHLLSHIKKVNKTIRISTQLIIGYPEETEDDFQETVNLVNSGIFDDIISADYSPTHGTLASKLPQLPKQKVLDRLVKIRQMIA